MTLDLVVPPIEQARLVAFEERARLVAQREITLPSIATTAPIGYSHASPAARASAGASRIIVST